MNIYFSNIQDFCAQYISAKSQYKPLGVFDKEIIISNSRAQGEWIKAEIAANIGCAAMIETTTVDSLVEKLAQKFIPADTVKLWGDKLPAMIFNHIEELLKDEKDFGDYINKIKGSRYGLSCEIAKCIERYQVYRFAYLEGKDSKGKNAFIKRIWDKLKNIFPDAISKDNIIAYAWQNRSAINFPKRISIVDCFGLTPYSCKVIQLLKDNGVEVNTILLNPSRAFWGDSYRRDIKKGIIESNPFLAMFGGGLRRQLNFLDDTMDATFIDSFEDVEGDNFLQNIQRSILDNNIDQFDANDDSFAMHDCHSARREVEALYEEVQKTLQNNKKLAYSDIQVLVINSNKYYHLIEDVFAQGANKIPIRLYGKVTPNDCREAFGLFLAAQEKNFDAESVMRLLFSKSMRRACNLSEDGITSIKRWLEEARFKSKISDGSYNCLEAIMEKITLGLCCSPEANNIVCDTHALPIHNLSTEKFNSLATAWLQISSWAETCANERKASLWREFIISAGNFLGDGQLPTQLINICRVLKNYIQHGDPIISFKEICDMVNDAQLETEPINNSANIVKVIPFGEISAPKHEVVFIVGGNESNFPSRDHYMPFDIMNDNMEPGDPNKREDQRLALLNSLTTTKTKLHVFYTSQDLAGERDAPLNSAMADIINCIKLLAPNWQVKKEKRYSFDPIYFSGYSNFNCSDLSVAEQLMKEPDLSAARNSDIEISDIEDLNDISIEMLSEFFEDPANHLARRQLGIRFPSLELDEGIDLYSIDPLQRYKIREELMSKHHTDFDEFHNAIVRRGLVSPITSSSKSLRSVFSAANHFHLHIQGVLGCSLPDKSELIKVDCEGVTLTAEVDFYNGNTFDVCLSKRSPAKKLRGWIRGLFLQAAGIIGETHKIYYTGADQFDIINVALPSNSIEHLICLMRLYKSNQGKVMPFSPMPSEKFYKVYDKTRDIRKSMSSATMEISSPFKNLAKEYITPEGAFEDTESFARNSLTVWTPYYNAGNK